MINQKSKDIDFYHQLIENMLIGYAYCRMIFENGKPIDFIHLDVNKAFRDLTGIRDPIGKKVSECIPGIQKSNPELFETYGRVALKGAPEHFEIYLPNLNTWLNISAHCPEKGHFIAMFENITERKKMEGALRQSEAKWKSLFSIIPAGVSILDEHGKLSEFNPALGNILAIDENGLKNGHYTQRCYFHADGTPMSSDEFPSIRAIREQRIVLNVEIGEMKENGEISWTLVSAAPLNLPGISCVVSTTDITQLKLMETQLLRTQKLESLGVLAGGIAHDFNNLMGGIYGLIDLANEEPNSKIVSNYLIRALATIDRARDLTAQLLTFATGGAPVQTLTSLNSFLQDTAQITLSRLGLRCKFEIGADLLPCNIDKIQIGQVINNIITNAKEAMPDAGSIEITAQNVTLGNNDHCILTAGSYVKLSIKDSGMGIPEKTKPRIFDPFFTTKEKSHGLGLPTSYSIINRHGGAIDVESNVGKGSTFHLYLPASIEPQDSTVTPAIKHKSEGKGIIIIMDDEEVMRDTISKVLQSLGYSVVCKSDGKEVLAFFIQETKAEHSITGLLLDLTVPGGMGGKTVAEEIRKVDSEIPIFVASGYADDPVMRNPVKYGFNASICKPFRKFELAEMLEIHLASPHTISIFETNHKSEDRI